MALTMMRHLLGLKECPRLQGIEMKYKLWLLFVLIFWIQGCDKPAPSTIKIAINPWPGYEFLYLAEKKGFFEKVGLNVKLIQLVSLADAQRAYINNQVDGFASTIIEAVQAEPLGGKPLKVVLVPDYSNGGDVILANKSIESMSDLKGRVVGAEVSSLGIYVLQRALTKSNMSLSDVTVLNVEQSDGEREIKAGNIDAFVTYPPVSVKMLKLEGVHKIFTSAQIPNEIIDTVSLSQDAIDRNPGVVKKLHQAWQMALDYAENNKEEAYTLMATREGISKEEFQDVLSDLMVLNAMDQKKLFETSDILQQSVRSVCETLVHVNSIEVSCDKYPDIIYRQGI